MGANVCQPMPSAARRNTVYASIAPLGPEQREATSNLTMTVACWVFYCYSIQGVDTVYLHIIYSIWYMYKNHYGHEIIKSEQSYSRLVL